MLSVIDSVISEYFGPTNTTTLANPDEWFMDWVTPGASDSGIRVNGTSAIESGAVYQALTVIGGDVGAMPLELFRRVGRSKELAEGHPLNDLWLAPHPELTRQMFLETLTQWALLWGNGVALIQRDGANRPVELLPLLPDRTFVQRDLDTGDLYYLTTIDKRRVAFPKEDIFHIPNLAMDGVWGKSVFEAARNAIGLDMAIEKSGNKSFSNTQSPAGVVTHPETMSSDARKEFRREWREIHGGIDNTGRVALLQEGATFHRLAGSNVDSQLVDALQKSPARVAPFFNIPLHKLGVLERATLNNIDALERTYLFGTLWRWLCRWTAESDRKLMSPRDRGTRRLFHRFDASKRTMGDPLVRSQIHEASIRGTWMSPNEVRDQLDMPPREGGDSYFNPTTTPGGDAGSPAEESGGNAATAQVKEAAIYAATEAAARVVSLTDRAIVRFAKKNSAESDPEWIAAAYESLRDQVQSMLAPPHAVCAAYVGADPSPSGIAAEYVLDSAGFIRASLSCWSGSGSIDDVIKGFTNSKSGRVASLASKISLGI